MATQDRLPQVLSEGASEQLWPEEGLDRSWQMKVLGWGYNKTDKSSAAKQYSSSHLRVVEYLAS